MNDLKFSELNKVNIQRCEKAYFPVDFWSPTDWGCALGGETGECLNFLKKLKRLDDAPTNDYLNTGVDQNTRSILLKMIGEELADIVVYADLLATRLGLNLADCVVEKFNIVSDRVGSDIKL